jgi:hypothetical protein
MPIISRSAQTLHKLFESKPVVQLEDVRIALSNASRATAFRYLQQVSYRHSYSHNGRYYTRHIPTRYDRFGLFSHKGILFSRDGSLIATLVRLVRESETGRTHHELRELLHVRVQVSLQQAISRGMIARERIEKLFVYLHSDPSVSQAQVRQRRQLLEAQPAEADLTDAVVIEVLLALLRHPGSRVADVVRRLRGHSPPIVLEQVRLVFDRYHLDQLGEKGGSLNC